MVRPLLVALLLAALAPSAFAASPEIDTDLAFCDDKLAHAPQEPMAYRCYWIVARRNGVWLPVIEHVEEFLDRDPENHRARLSLALLYGDQGRMGRAFSFFGAVVEGFAREEDARGEVYARHNWAYLLIHRGDFDAAEKLLEAGERVADESGDDMLRVAIYVEQALLAQRRGQYGRSWDRNRKAEMLLVDDHPVRTFLQSRIMGGLAEAARATARYRDAMAIFERRANLLREASNPFDEAFALLNAARMANRLWREGNLERDELESLSRQALERAQQAGNDLASADARLLAADFLPKDRARAELEKALEYATFWGERAFLARVYRRLSRHARQHGENALPLAETAYEAARESGDPLEVAASRIEVAEARWAHAPSKESMAAWDRAIAAIEKVRNLQSEDSVRARVLADWSFVYYRYASLLLERYRASGDREHLERLFEISERNRSRVLLDRLDAAGAAPEYRGNEELLEQRRDVLARIVAVQRELLDSELSDGRRSDLLATLDQLEDSETSVRERLASLDQSTAAIRDPSFPSLLEAESMLDEDEALLSFNMPGVRAPDGALPDAWLQLSTSTGTRILPLPSHELVDPAVEVFLGLLERRDGSERLGAERLYELLLDEAVRSLPDSIHRLILVPDGAVHRLPFAALHDGNAPLVARFESFVIPSVTAFRRWRARRENSFGPVALVLADPTPPSSKTAVQRERDPTRTWALPSGARLGSLPHARREGRAIASLLGAGTLVLEGDEASERFVKSADLDSFGIVHFAAHGVVDAVNPERSAVLLAPGAHDEDGLLQLRDIVDLDFFGKLVVLSACRSASGEVVRAEGVLGLARAFFQAGAQSVIGGLWPLDDREASETFQAFYRYLRSGISASAALRATQLELLERGADTAAWAGIVALGDAEIAPVEPVPPRRFRRSIVFVLAIALLVVAVRRFPRALN